MFTEKDLVGLYLRYDEKESYKITSFDGKKVIISSLHTYYGKEDNDIYYTDYELKYVLKYLNDKSWEFIFHDDIVSKHKVMQELIESRDKDNINIVIEMYKTLKQEENGICKI